MDQGTANESIVAWLEDIDASIGRVSETRTAPPACQVCGKAAVLPPPDDPYQDEPPENDVHIYRAFDELLILCAEHLAASEGGAGRRGGSAALATTGHPQQQSLF